MISVPCTDKKTHLRSIHSTLSLVENMKKTKVLKVVRLVYVGNIYLKLAAGEGDQLSVGDGVHCSIGDIDHRGPGLG